MCAQQLPNEEGKSQNLQLPHQALRWNMLEP
jgi:hypothetical protein